MIKIVKNLFVSLQPKSSFVKGVGILFGGTAFSQIILLIGAPLLTRLYTPEDFGLLAVYGSILAFASVVSCLNYEQAIPLCEDENSALNIAILCFILVITSGLVTCFIIYFWGALISQILEVQRLIDYLWLLPLGILLTGFYNILNYWGLRTKQFRDISLTKFCQATTTLIVQLVGFKYGATALLAGQLTGQTLANSILTIKIITKKDLSKFNFSMMMVGFSRYRFLSLGGTCSSLVNTAGHQLPPLVFASFFSAATVGSYALAFRLLTLPASLVGAAFSQVFLSHGVDSQRTGNLNILYAKVQNSLFQLGLSPAIAIIFIAPELFSFIFGEIWREAGIYSQWLSLSAFLGFVVSPLSNIFTILERQALGLTLQLFLLMLRFSGLLIGAYGGDPFSAVKYYSIGSAIGYIAYLYFGAIISGCTFRETIKSIIYNIKNAILVFIPILIGYYSESSWINIFMIFLSVLIYGFQCQRLLKQS